MTDAWLHTLTPETRQWLERLPEDVLAHPYLPVVLTMGWTLDDRSLREVEGIVRAKMHELAEGRGQ